MAMHLELGKQGEKWAREHFLKNYYEILEENWTFGKAEVDLIVFQDETLVFVEVKTRSGSSFGQPEDFVDLAKQKQMQLAAEEYIRLMEHKGEVRFDIFAVLIDKNSQPILKHIPDAFWPGQD
ncbi:MAG: YraN family protein [Sphingobacteriaceae bacterium]